MHVMASHYPHLNFYKYLVKVIKVRSEYVIQKVAEPFLKQISVLLVFDTNNHLFKELDLGLKFLSQSLSHVIVSAHRRILGTVSVVCV